MPGRNTGQEKVFAFSIVYLTGCTPFCKRYGGGYQLFLSYDAKSGQFGISELPAFFVSVFVLPKRLFYIMPPMPPAGIAGAAWGSLMVATADSVVSRVLATLVAFSSAVLVTFAGSRMPSLTIST